MLASKIPLYQLKHLSFKTVLPCLIYINEYTVHIKDILGFKNSCLTSPRTGNG